MILMLKYPSNRRLFEGCKDPSGAHLVVSSARAQMSSVINVIPLLVAALFLHSYKYE